MKKNVLMAAAFGCAILLAGCGLPAASPATGTGKASAASTGAATSNTGTQGLLGSLLSGLIGNVTPVSAASIKGTWTYTSPECRFESENFLTQAGGTVMANKVENQLGSTLSKLGFKQGSTTFVFDGNNGCTIMSGNKTILNGTYTLDSKTRAISIRGAVGLINLNGTVYLSGNTLTLLFDADKLTGFIKGVGTLLGKSNGTLSSLFDYDGMKLGMNLTK